MTTPTGLQGELEKNEVGYTAVCHAAVTTHTEETHANFNYLTMLNPLQGLLNI
jgi:hypothetical protein